MMASDEDTHLFPQLKAFLDYHGKNAADLARHLKVSRTQGYRLVGGSRGFNSRNARGTVEFCQTLDSEITFERLASREPYRPLKKQNSARHSQGVAA
jgi:hypothetical protein